MIQKPIRSVLKNLIKNIHMLNAWWNMRKLNWYQRIQLYTKKTGLPNILYPIIIIGLISQALSSWLMLMVDFRYPLLKKLLLMNVWPITMIPLSLIHYIHFLPATRQRLEIGTIILDCNSLNSIAHRLRFITTKQKHGIKKHSIRIVTSYMKTHW